MPKFKAPNEKCARCNGKGEHWAIIVDKFGEEHLAKAKCKCSWEWDYTSGKKVSFY